MKILWFIIASLQATIALARRMPYMVELFAADHDRHYKMVCRLQVVSEQAHPFYPRDKEPFMKHYFAAITSTLALSLSGSYVWAADLIETASTSGTFKTFVAAAEASGIADKLQKSGPYTVFAPTDSAFEKLPPGTMDTLMKNKAKLAEVLAHHIIPGKIAVADVKPGKVQTLQGDMLTLTSDNGKVTVDNANVIQSDLMADNGVIHEIDIVVLQKK